MTALLAYVASALTVGSLGMKTMLPLRIFALCGNLMFVAYGVFEQYYVVTAVNLVILPVNVWRLIEIKRLIRNVRDASNDNHVTGAPGDRPAGRAERERGARQRSVGGVLGERN